MGRARKTRRSPVIARPELPWSPPDIAVSWADRHGGLDTKITLMLNVLCSSKIRLFPTKNSIKSGWGGRSDSPAGQH